MAFVIVIGMFNVRMENEKWFGKNVNEKYKPSFGSSREVFLKNLNAVCGIIENDEQQFVFSLFGGILLAA